MPASTRLLSAATASFHQNLHSTEDRTQVQALIHTVIHGPNDAARKWRKLQPQCGCGGSRLAPAGRQTAIRPHKHHGPCTLVGTQCQSNLRARPVQSLAWLGGAPDAQLAARLAARLCPEARTAWNAHPRLRNWRWSAWRGLAARLPTRALHWRRHFRSQPGCCSPAAHANGLLPVTGQPAARARGVRRAAADS